MPVLPARHNLYHMKPNITDQSQNRRLQNSNIQSSDPSLIHEQAMHDDFTALKLRKNSLSSSASQSALPTAIMYTSANIQSNYQHDLISSSSCSNEDNNLIKYNKDDSNKLGSTITASNVAISDTISGTTIANTRTLPASANEVLPEFGASKLDPKYQTLPYNTKFTINYLTSSQSSTLAPSMATQTSTTVNKVTNSVSVSNSSNVSNLIGRRPSGEGGESVIDGVAEEIKNVGLNLQQQQSQQQVMNVVYSIPIPSGINKGLATGLANEMRPTSASSVGTSSISSLSNSPSPSSSAIPGTTINSR